MKLTIAVAIILSVAYQALKAEPVFTTQVQSITVHEALAKAVNKEKVYKCEEVELKINKSSVSLKKKVN